MKKLLSLMLCLCIAICGLAFASAESDPVVYRTLYSGEIGTLNYLTTSTTNDYTLSANVIDTLIEHDRYGNLVPCLAEDWSTSEDGLTWTFTLRKGVKWVTSTGEYYADVTANDFVTSAEYILNAQHASSTASILRDYIVGAREYYKSTSSPKEGEEAPAPMDFADVGVKALDDYTIAYTTKEPCPYFLTMLDYICYMPVNAKFLAEKGDDFGVATSETNLLYCGPYILTELKPQEKRVYTKNESYWDKDNVFIDVIEQTYNSQASIIAPAMYLKGEIDAADIDSKLASEWLADPETADMIHPVRQFGQFSYFWAFNFDPNFDEEYEPDNWKIAVNNEAFRLSISYAFDRVKAKTVIEPENPEDLLWTTIMPQGICVIDGTDYTELGEFDDIITDPNIDLALFYKAKAVEELTALGATFPIKVLNSYISSSTSQADECVVVKQQLEEVLGTDYIEVINYPGPANNFLSAIRRTGKYGFMRCNWGLDFDDPINLTEPFKEDNNYNFFINATDPALMNEDGVLEYYVLVNAAKAMPGSDMAARYKAFAQAEAYLINHAIVIPYGSNTGGYTASRLNPFEGQFGATGLASCRFKGQHLLDKPMSTDEYFDAYDQWLEERAALAK
ncbi:MAG: peptide ABC transporter substrate-binding protein [Clostridiales bacterium]|nr:peptide ABC transporter substrate-binding protein [Clostridiales bacterium]